MPYSNKNQRRLTGYRGDTNGNNSSLVLGDEDSNDGHPELYTIGHQHDIYDEYDDNYTNDNTLNNRPIHNQYQQQHYSSDDHYYSEVDTGTTQQQRQDQEHDALDEGVDDDSGSELSIPDPNIDFDMVYALHTFAATVDGQASVVRGDALTLLDDTNSYWWLVKVLKTAEVGYIPAENIETPYERLARLNSHRNIELTRKDIQDVFPAPPSNKARKQKRVTLAKEVKFQSQIIYGGFSDEDDDYYGNNVDDDNDSYFEAEFQQWKEKMRSDDDDDDTEDGSEIIVPGTDNDDFRYSSDDPYHQYCDEAYEQHSEQQEQQLLSPTATAEKIEVDGNGYDKIDTNAISSASTNDSQYNISAEQPKQRQKMYEHQNYDRFSMESESINNDSRESFNLGKDETIKISLTPSIARGDGDDSTTAHHSDAQAKLKKAAKLEKLLSEPINTAAENDKGSNNGKNPSKKEKSGIRKLFSRDNSKEKKKDKKKNKDDKNTAAVSNNPRASLLSSSSTSLERLSSTASTLETASLESQSNSITSIDPYLINTNSGTEHNNIDQLTTINDQPGTKRLKINAGNITIFSGHTYVDVYPTTTTQELIDYITANMINTIEQPSRRESDSLQQDYFLIVKTQNGDELTLVPSDKPLEIYQSLTSHLNTPMPSLKKARRISQLMEGENVHLGGPTGAVESNNNEETAVQFFLFCRTKRMEEGEIQIRVSLYPGNNVEQQQHQKRLDKLIKVPVNILAKDAVTLLLEKFHILNGVAAAFNSTINANDVNDNIKSLRLEEDKEVVQYRLGVNHQDGLQSLVDPDQRLLDVFDERNMPHIHYKRNSNPDSRSSITVNTITSERDEIYFILTPLRKETGNLEPNMIEAMNTRTVDTNEEKAINDAVTPGHPAPAGPHRVTRHNTPMPRHDSSSAINNDIYPEQMSLSSLLYQPQVVLEDRKVTIAEQQNYDTLIASSPEEDKSLCFDTKTTLLTNSPTNSTINAGKDTTTLSDMSTITNTIDTTPTMSATTASPATPTPISYSPPTIPNRGYKHIAAEQLSAAPTAATDAAMVYNNKNLPRPESDSSLLFCDDFGINDLMVLIRGAAISAVAQHSHRTQESISNSNSAVRNEINTIFKDSQTRLDQLEKELDRIMAEAVKVYS
ncbi:hypothetical protein BDF20DRAFT_885660 [Mycotypha africana]|uniref:uncharacterized protein n=1 Tax=Mycotypha africana TaxID=64632 RepID=UPI0023004BD8|nr:uncharacterized protein BDF20DRAFT_885660 [Mycotypha africana]KAI8971657.1 hypothetical protein BDF20DRAFT_885660 [Mycotypha africana]